MQRLWRSKTRHQQAMKNEQLTVINNKEQNYLLPNQIGCRIIELEMQIMQTQNLNKEIILELLHQYSKAIEFYEERGSNKHLLYQKKLQNFLHKPAVAQILKGKTGTLLIKKQKNQQQLKKANTQSQIVAKKLIEQSNQSGKKQQDILKKQLENQQRNLQQRIQRKRAMSGKSTKTIQNTNSNSKQNNDTNLKIQQILISQFNQLTTNTNSGSKKQTMKVFI